MEAAKLRHRITIQRPKQGRTPSGQVIADGWEDVCSIWAQVKCTTAHAVNAEGVIVYEGLYKFFIRWRPGLTAGMRVKWGKRIFELTAPPADWESEHVGLTLITRELVDYGKKA